MQKSFNSQGSPMKNSLTQGTNQLWKTSNEKAQKNGAHHTIYWVKPQQKYEDGSFKGEKWITSGKYTGEWKENKKEGFGVQQYANGNKYEGEWRDNMRNGHGTLWMMEGKKLRREYTGTWINDKKTGRGSMFYGNEDRYDGFWLDDFAHGEGRMIYHNGDIYEGQWSFGKKSGYGILTKRSGDHFEGQWVNDKREGNGSYYFASKNKVFVGEWVDDTPKAGVYSDVDDPNTLKSNKPEKFTDSYAISEIPQIGLADPSGVLENALEDAKQTRMFYRARFIPINELFTEDELRDLLREFETAANEGEVLNLINLRAILYNLNFDQSEEEIRAMVFNLDEQANPDEVDFETFSRVVALYLEFSNNPRLNFNQEERAEYDNSAAINEEVEVC